MNNFATAPLANTTTPIFQCLGQVRTPVLQLFVQIHVESSFCDLMSTDYGHIRQILI